MSTKHIVIAMTIISLLLIILLAACFEKKEVRPLCDIWCKKESVYSHENTPIPDFKADLRASSGKKDYR